MRGPSVDGDGRLEVILKKDRKPRLSRLSGKGRGRGRGSRTKAKDESLAMSHTCHIDIKNIDVEVDYRGIVMLRWPGEFVVLHEQVLLQPIGPGLVPYGGPCNTNHRGTMSEAVISLIA